MVFVLEALPASCALVLATVSDSFQQLRMTARSWRLDFTLSAHLMSDGPGSHCKMIFESPRQLDIFTSHVSANVSVAPFVSTSVVVPYPNATSFKTR